MGKKYNCPEDERRFTMENRNTDEIYKAFGDYIHSCTDKDRELWERVRDLEDTYFRDMTFQVDSILRDYLQFEIANENGVFSPSHTDVCEKLSSLSNAYCRFYVKDLPPRIAGRYNSREKTITISPEYSNNQAVIMHEMIHAYEDSLHSEPDFYRDILFMCLYKELSGKVEDLDSRILAHSHVFEAEIISSYGGAHGMLFFLKSLELDLRCGYKLGTVCGYGRDELDILRTAAAAPDDYLPDSAVNWDNLDRHIN
jgi:hypothetical protein